MLQILGRQNLLVWLILMSVTLLSWLLSGDPIGQAGSALAGGIAMIVLAFIKVRLVIRYFMEVRHAPMALQLICDAWIVIAGAGIIALYAGVLSG